MRYPHLASSPLAAAASAVARFARRLRDAGERRRAVRSLASLDDHMLRDIGLTRFDVETALAEPALTDGTLVLAERAQEQRRLQRALVQDARAARAPGPLAGRAA